MLAIHAEYSWPLSPRGRLPDLSIAGPLKATGEPYPSGRKENTIAMAFPSFSFAVLLLSLLAHSLFFTPSLATLHASTAARSKTSSSLSVVMESILVWNSSRSATVCIRSFYF